MWQRKRVEWTRLDNASKHFPAVCNDRDTKVFRLVCELCEAVEPGALQQALDITIEHFPLYKSVLRRGVFWYYLETGDIHPGVEFEDNPVCAPIYKRDNRNLLFRVFYFGRRINLEIFHALSDGTGAVWFMQTLIYHYLLLKYKEKFAGNSPQLKYSASISKKMDDSFGRYFNGKDNRRPTKTEKEAPSLRVYHIRGTRMDDNRMQVIEGSMSAGAVLEKAHEHHTTLTVYLAALFIYAIYNEMPAHEQKKSIILSIPINLRQFFKSETARNFFSTMHVGHTFGTDRLGFENIIESITEGFKRELTEERLIRHLNQLMALEKQPFARVAPLPFKDYSIRIANKIKDRGITAALSNIGRIDMPLEFDAYIKQFSVFTSARRPQFCVCSYRDRLVVSFTSPFRETEIQRNFFKLLAEKGIDIEITSNL